MGIVLTHSAKYKPMSFDEMIKPYQMMTEEYRRLEEGISELETKAETMRNWAERNPNSEYAADYNAYATKLEQAASDLATKGLKSVNRKSILDLNKDYATKIKPIEDAAAYVKEKAKEQQTLVNSSKGRIRFDRDFNSADLNLQDVIDSNNTLGYNIYDLDRYAKDAILEGTALKNAETPIATVHPKNRQYNIVSQGLAANDPRVEAKVQEILQTIPENLRPEIEAEIRANVTNAAAVTSKLEANRGYETPAQINARIKSNATLEAQMARENMKWDEEKQTWKLTELSIQLLGDKQNEYYNKRKQQIKKDENGNYIMKDDGTFEIEPMDDEEYQTYLRSLGRKTSTQTSKSASEIEKDKRKEGINLLYDENGNREEEPNKWYTISDNNYYKAPIEDIDLPDSIFEKKKELANRYGVNISDIEVYASDQVDTRNWATRRVYRFVGKGMRDPRGELKTTSVQVTTSKKEDVKKEGETGNGETVQTGNRTTNSAPVQQ